MHFQNCSQYLVECRAKLGQSTRGEPDLDPCNCLSLLMPRDIRFFAATSCYRAGHQLRPLLPAASTCPAPLFSAARCKPRKILRSATQTQNEFLLSSLLVQTLLSFLVQYLRRSTSLQQLSRESARVATDTPPFAVAWAQNGRLAIIMTSQVMYMHIHSWMTPLTCSHSSRRCWACPQ